MTIRDIPDDVLIEAYQIHGSVWKAAEWLGVRGQSLHRRLKNAGCDMSGHGKRWTAQDDDRLIADYQEYANAGRLSELAESMGRTKYFIARKARELGLTNKNRKRPYHAKWVAMPDDDLWALFDELVKSDLGFREFCASKGIDDLGMWREMTNRFPAEWDALMELKRTASSKYRRGRDFEYRTKKKLEDAGFLVVRAAGSKGPADLVAFKEGELLFVQCKIGDWHEVKAWNELIELAESVGAKPIFAQGKNRKTMFWVMKRKDESRRSVLGPECEYSIQEVA